MGTDIICGDRHKRWGQTSKVGTDIIRGDRHKKLRSRVGGWVGGSKEILDPTLALQSIAWIQNPSSSRVWQNLIIIIMAFATARMLKESAEKVYKVPKN